MKHSLLLVCALLVTLGGCGAPTNPNLPDYELVGSQAVMRIVHVAESVVGDDNALWAVADDLRRESGARILHVMFWTDRSQTPTRLPMTSQQVESMRVVININDNTILRALERQP